MYKIVRIILPLAVMAAITGIFSGINRIGWDLPLFTSTASLHGILMTGSFLGTLISLERVIAVKKKWAWIAPIVMALAFPVFLGAYVSEAIFLLLAGAGVYAGVSGYLAFRIPHKGNTLMFLGSIFQVLALLVFLITQSYPMAMAAWFLSFLFTIVGERLHLSNFLPVKKNQYYSLYAGLVIAVAGTTLYHSFSPLPAALGFLLLAIWLLQNDIIQVVIKNNGFYAYLGYVLGTGYVWLAIFSVLSSFRSEIYWHYDAVVHSFFAGFILNMIMAHAPIIFPAVLGIKGKPFSRWLYVPFILLNIFNLLRISADVMQLPDTRRWAGMFSGLAFLSFIFLMAGLMIRLHQNVGAGPVMAETRP